MTHHNNTTNVDDIMDKAFKDEAGNKSATKGEAAKEEEKKIDYSKVNQAVTEVPNPAKGATLEIPEKALSGKGSTKGHAEITKKADQVTCSFCGIPISKGGLGAVVPVKGKKFKKSKEGKYALRSPGADGGEAVGVLCVGHAIDAKLLPEGAIDIKNVVAIDQEGNVQNLPVSQL